MTKRVADLIVETLRAAGVERCYGIVGDTLNRSLMPSTVAQSNGSICVTRRQEPSLRAPKLSSRAASPPAQARAAPAVSTSSTDFTRPIATARPSS